MKYLKRALFTFVVLLCVCYPSVGHSTEYLKPLVLYGVSTGGLENKELARTQLEIDICKKNAGVQTCLVQWLDEKFQQNLWWAHFSYEYIDWDGNNSGPMESSIIMSIICPANVSVDTADKLCIRTDPDDNCDICTKGQNEVIDRLGDPVSVANGVNIQTESDYSNYSGSLSFSRTYRSDRTSWSTNFDSMALDLNISDPDISGNSLTETIQYGDQIFLNHRFPFIYPTRTNNLIVRRGNGRIINFGGDAGFDAPVDINDSVEPVFDSNNNKTGYVVRNSVSGAFERYSLNGAIVEEIFPSGKKRIFTYSDATTIKAVSPFSGFLTKVADEYGNNISFSYDEYGRMKSFIDPDGNETYYTYDGNGLLTSVQRPDGTTRTYIYGEAPNIGDSSQIRKLTGIIDETGSRFATFKYNSSGRTISTEEANGAAKWTFSYSGYYTDVVDPRGLSSTHAFSKILGTWKNYAIAYSFGNSYFSISTDYDTHGNVSNRTYGPLETSYAYDLSRNLETLRIEAPNTPIARYVSTTWHSDYRLPLVISEPKRLTTFTYDPQGRLLKRTQQATLDLSGAEGTKAVPVGQPLVWEWTYNQFGNVLTERAPGSVGRATQTNVYDAKGNLSSVTNALGQVTTYSDYDGNGRARCIVTPNRLATILTYTVRGMIASITRSANALNETTYYSYDSIGDISKITVPDGSVVSYTYDASHRLIRVSDSIGNRIEYVLDNSGNRISEKISDSDGILRRNVTRFYDSWNHLQQVIGLTN